MCLSSQAVSTQDARALLRRATTPTCLDSTGKGKVIDFFAISEELHPFVRTVVVDERPTVIRTHWSVVPTLAGVKRGRLVLRLRRPARLRVAPVGPSRRRPSCAELLDMLSECESDAVMRATLDEAALQLGRTVETEVLGLHDLVDEEKYTGRVTGANGATSSASGQAWTRAGRERGEAALWNLLVQRIGALRSVLSRAPTARCGTVICNICRIFCGLRWHFAHDPPAMWSWWKRWWKSLSRWTDAWLRVVQQICM